MVSAAERQFEGQSRQRFAGSQGNLSGNRGMGGLGVTCTGIRLVLEIDQCDAGVCLLPVISGQCQCPAVPQAGVELDVVNVKTEVFDRCSQACGTKAGQLTIAVDRLAIGFRLKRQCDIGWGRAVLCRIAASSQCDREAGKDK